jgi:hypothetical protein
MGNNQREFKGIWIPKEIWEDDNLTMAEKIFLVEINSLDNTEKGCYANNEYFSKFFKVSKNRVSEVINSLVEKGYLKSSIKEGEGNKRMLKTLYNFSGIGSTTKGGEVSNKTGRGSTTLDGEGLQEKGEHNNTINNPLNNPISNTTHADALLWPTFEDFWEKYDHKIDRSKCEKKWKKIAQGAREKIMEHLELYVRSTPDKKYRRHPETYLNNNSWENEIDTTTHKPISKKQQHTASLLQGVKSRHPGAFGK